MLNKKNKWYQTVIGGKTKVIDTAIHSDDNIQIDGFVVGKIHCEEEVFVSQYGEFEGHIESKHVSVSGSVKGDIVVSEYVHISSTGVIDGEIKCKSLIIDEGGVLNGRSNMIEDKDFEEEEDE